MKTHVLFSADHLSKSFAVKVLSNINFDLTAGEIHGLVGANGAGKSTFCNIIAGLTIADSGCMTLDGKTYQPRKRTQSIQAGVQMVHQELSLIHHLTVAENLFLNKLPTRCGVIQHRQLLKQAAMLLNRIGLPQIDPDCAVASLGAGQQQLVEIAMALSRQCKILILDEPTSSLNSIETQQLFEWLRELKDQGIGIIFISHRLDELSLITDRISILRDGELVYTGSTDKITPSQILDQIACKNRKTQTETAFKSYCKPELALRVKNLKVNDQLQDISFHLRRGERLGVAGLMGSGRTELLNAIYGEVSSKRGSIQVLGDTMDKPFQRPHLAAQNGLGMLPEDRKESGVLLDLNLTQNLTISSLKKKFSRFGITQEAKERRVSDDLLSELGVSYQDQSQYLHTLSGGNQQKIAFGKWLITHTQTLLLDEPTRGIDAAARLSLYTLMERFVSRGKSIIMVSSDLDELMQTCDRIIVLAGGQLSQTFDRATWKSEEIIKACFANSKTEEDPCN